MTNVYEKAKRIGRNALVGALVVGGLGVAGCSSLDREVKSGGYTLADNSTIEIRNAIHPWVNITSGGDTVYHEMPVRHTTVEKGGGIAFYFQEVPRVGNDLSKVRIKIDGNWKTYFEGPIFEEGKHQLSKYHDKIDSIYADRADSAQAVQDSILEVLTR